MKPSITISLLLSTFFFVATPSHSQLPCEALPLPQEQVSLHLDRNVCLAGETIWFKAWCFLDGQLERELSKVLYVEIFDETGKAIVQQKYLLTGNKAAGSIRIPEDAATKYYFLKAYTRYMRNFSTARFHYQQIVIVNPFIENATIPAGPAAFGERPGGAPVPPTASHTPERYLQVALSQEKYSPREPIRFSINSKKPITAELSTVVRLKGLGNQPAPGVLHQNRWLQASCQDDPFCKPGLHPEREPDGQAPSPVQKEGRPLNAGDLQWLPETRGLTISGFVQNEQGERVTDAAAIVAVLQEAPMLHKGLTDEEGAFTVGLQHMQHQKALFAGTPNENHKVLIRNDFDTDLPAITTVPLQFDAALHRLLESLNLHQQLDQAYPQHKTEPVFQPAPLHIPPTNLLGPDRRIVLGNFINVPTMEEVFREITTGVALRKKEGEQGLSVFNDIQQKWYDSPLVLLDNVPVFNIEELLKIDPAQVEAVEVYDSDYILGDFTIGGIVSVLTKTEDFAGYEWGAQAAFTTFTAFAAPRAFEQVAQQDKSHYPDFLPVLFWQPGLPLHPEKPAEEITVLAPDRPGAYEIVVQGFTNSGEACLGYAVFEVVRE